MKIFSKLKNTLPSLTLVTLAMLANFWVYINLAHTLSLRNSSEFEIIFLDVGQGDSILIKTAQGGIGIIDAGPESNILPSLYNNLSYFERKIDFLIATHADADHVSGILEILDRFEVKNLYLPLSKKDTEIFEAIVNKANQFNINSYILNKNTDFYFDGLNFDILWPNESTAGISDINDESYAINISTNKFSLLTMGDLSNLFELEAAKALKNKDIDVLKVSHHGSASSTGMDLLDLVTPELAVVSAGKNNSYGHPSAEVLGNLMSKNIQVFRTDQQGDINIRIQNNCYSVIARSVETLRCN